MSVDTNAEIRVLRTVLRDLVALSAIPAALAGREPAAVAAGKSKRMEIKKRTKLRRGGMVRKRRRKGIEDM